MKEVFEDEFKEDYLKYRLIQVLATPGVEPEILIAKVEVLYNYIKNIKK